MNEHINEQLQTLKEQFHPYESTLASLAPALGAAVPLYVLQFERNGGVTEADIGVCP